MLQKLFWAFCAVFGAALFSVLNPYRIQSPPDNVIPDARKILDLSAPHKNNRMLLKVVAHARNIGSDFHPVG